MKKTDKLIHFLGYELFSGEKEELLAWVKDWLSDSRETAYIFTPNPEQIVQATQDKTFATILKQATVLIPDGVGLIWGSRFLSLVGKGRPLQQRISGREVAAALIKQLVPEGHQVLIIGGRSLAGRSVGQIPIVTAEAWQSTTLAWTPGYDNVNSPRADEEAHLTSLLKKLKPSLVLVAFGAPAQEKWVIGHQELLQKSHVKVAIVVGGTFDTLTGQLALAPIWMQKIGLEWLFRLWQQPSRWQRQLRLFSFIKVVLQAAFTNN